MQMCVDYSHVDKLIKDLTVANLPHSNIVVGESGSGKHTLVKRLSDNLELPLYDITDKISQEVIEEIYLSSQIAMYIIDGNQISIKDQNTVLKFIEEPSANIYIFILVDNILQLLPTVRNRCIQIKIPPYYDEELEAFSSDYLYLMVFRTPGLIQKAKELDLGKLIDYQNKIIASIAKANLSNVLSIKDKIKVEIPQIESNYDIFFRVFETVLLEHMRNDASPLYRDMYRCVDQYSIQCRTPKVVAENMFIRFLLDFKAIADGYKRN